MIIARTAKLRRIIGWPVAVAEVDLEWQPWWIRACRSLRIPTFVAVVDSADVMLVDAVAVRLRVFVSDGRIAGITNKDPNRPPNAGRTAKVAPTEVDLLPREECFTNLERETFQKVLGVGIHRTPTEMDD